MKAKGAHPSRNESTSHLKEQLIGKTKKFNRGKERMEGELERVGVPQKKVGKATGKGYLG